MGFYYAAEKKRFERKWVKLRKEYEAAGMDQADIQLLYEYDLEFFRSQRTYMSHTQAMPNEYFQDGQMDGSTLIHRFRICSSSFDEADFPGRYAWVDSIENQRLTSLLRQLSDDDLELLTFLVLEEHTQRELAQKWGCSQKTISTRLKRIKGLLK